MSRRQMQVSNRKATSQRRAIHDMQRVRERERKQAERSLFSGTDRTEVSTPVDSNKYSPNPVYRRETLEYPSNNAVGGSTTAPERFYANNSSITIGQAYNKGNLVVLTNDESNDPRTGKRR